ncbi:hypothetical protein Efla_006941 [Eimeria flavescens]
MEPTPQNGRPQQACGDGDATTDKASRRLSEDNSGSLMRGRKPSRPVLASELKASKDGVTTPPVQAAPQEQPAHSESAVERSRGPRFNAVVDVVYYDSKLSQKSRLSSSGEGGADGEADSRQASRDADESSAEGSSDDVDQRGSRLRAISRISRSWRVLAHRQTEAEEEGVPEPFHSSSDLEPKDEIFLENLEPLNYPCSRFLPKWANIGLRYIAAVHKDFPSEELGPSQLHFRPLRSFRPFMFKRDRAEAEFANFNLRKMPFQVVIGTIFLMIIFTIHFGTLYTTFDMTGLVVGEFVVSIFLVLTMTVICFCYWFRRILELALTVDIALLFFFRAVMRTCALAASIGAPRSRTLGLFVYNMMGSAETLMLLVIPFYLASVRYVFCFWLSCLVVLWIVPIVGLSMKLAADVYKEEEAGYWFWCPIVYVLLAGLVFALDYSCAVHEYKRRTIFWKLKMADELMEGQTLHKRNREHSHVPSTPLEGAINNLDRIQSLLCNSKLLDKEKESLQRLLNEARHNLTFTDNIYDFLNDLRREGISKPRKLSRKTSLAVRRKSRVSGLVDTLAAKTNLSKIGVDWSFNCIALGQISQKPLYDVGYAILSPFCLSPDISLNRDILCSFLHELSSQYLDNPYHNALHGATVCHMALCLLEMLSVREFMNDVEDFSAGIASLCHDVGHPGRNNNFMIAVGTDLAITYNDGSVLENHHASLTFRILGKPQCNILEKVAPVAYRAIRKYVIEWILATDMKMHFDHISSFRTRRTNAEFNLATNEEDRSRIISMCIKAADLGHAATVWEQHEEWCRRVVTEFYEQGDEEERLGLPKSFLCDRSNHDKDFLPSQIKFITFVVRPLYDELKATDDALQLSKEQEIARVCIANLETNATNWQRKENKIPD